jgi:hypothetical protein
MSHGALSEVYVESQSRLTAPESLSDTPPSVSAGDPAQARHFRNLELLLEVLARKTFISMAIPGRQRRQPLPHSTWFPATDTGPSRTNGPWTVLSI